MTDPTQTPAVEPQSLGKQAMALVVRHVVGGFGLYLVGHGLLDKADAPQFADALSGFAMFALAIAWSFGAKLIAKAHWVQALLAPAPATLADVHPKAVAAVEVAQQLPAAPADHGPPPNQGSGGTKDPVRVELTVTGADAAAVAAATASSLAIPPPAGL